MIILDKTWFGTVGIVACENDEGERKFYIGVGNGFSEEADAHHIKDYGTKVYPEHLTEFFERNKKA